MSCGHSLKECLDVRVSGSRCCVMCTGRHAVDPYRVCFECGYTYDTKFDLVIMHLAILRDMDMEYRLEECVPELIHICPNCTHDF